MLEDYEIIFPEIENVRIQLYHRQLDLLGLLGEFDRGLKQYINAESDKSQINCFIEDSSIIIQRHILDQICLMEDLRKYLQNRTLSQITGNKIPERKPLDLSVPKIVMNKTIGLLEIQNNDIGKSSYGKIINDIDKNNFSKQT